MAKLCAEFYSRPQRYLLGASDEVFEDKTKWEAYTGLSSAYFINSVEYYCKYLFGQVQDGR